MDGIERFHWFRVGFLWGTATGFSLTIFVAGLVKELSL